MSECAIVGGGISGLTAAYYLLLQGHEVRLFEPGALGGVIRSHSVAGYTIEQGPNVFAEKPELAALIDRLGLRASVVYPRWERFRQYVWYQGAPCRVPKDPLTFISTPLLAGREKLRLLTNLLLNRSLNLSQGEVALAELCHKLAGPVAAQRLFDPVLKGILGGNIGDLSASALFPELVGRLQSGGGLRAAPSSGKPRGKRRLFVVRGGNQRLASELAAKVGAERVVQEAVQSVRRTGSRFEVVTSSGCYGGFSQVFVATSAAVSAGIIAELEPQLAADLRRVRFAAITVAHAGATAAPPDERGFGVLFPPEAAGALLGIMYNSALFPHVAPDGKHLYTLCFGGVGAERGAAAREAHYGELVPQLLEKMIAVPKAELLSVQHWPAAIPQYEMGHLALMAEMHRAEARHPGLHFIGADLGGVGVPDRVAAAGRAVAASGAEHTRTESYGAGAAAH